MRTRIASLAVAVLALAGGCVAGYAYDPGYPDGYVAGYYGPGYFGPGPYYHGYHYGYYARPYYRPYRPYYGHEHWRAATIDGHRHHM